MWDKKYAKIVNYLSLNGLAFPLTIVSKVVKDLNKSGVEVLYALYQGRKNAFYAKKFFKSFGMDIIVHKIYFNED